MLPELKSTLQQLLKLPQEEEEIPEAIANTETAEGVKTRIRQLLAKASYKYVKGSKKLHKQLVVNNVIYANVLHLKKKV